MIEKYVDAEELKRLLSTLIVVLGALVIAGLFASIVVPGLRNANRPPTPMPVNPVVGEPGWLDPTEFPPEEGKDDSSGGSRDPDRLFTGPGRAGKGASSPPNCAFCHGASGRGDGPAAATMNPRPRNFTSPDGWTNGYDLPAIFQTLSAGVPGTSMASFDYLSKSDRMALAHYVQSLGAFPHGPGSPEALARSVEGTRGAGGEDSEQDPGEHGDGQAGAGIRRAAADCRWRRRSTARVRSSSGSVDR